MDLEVHLRNIADAAASSVRKEVHLEAETDDEETEEGSFQLQVSILKSNDEKQIVMGVVLQPEVVDAQGDIMSADVIEESAHAFLMEYNKSTKLGFQHKEFKKGRFALVESYVAQSDMVLGTTGVKRGSWVIGVKVLEKKMWDKVKDGSLTGFSIGGQAKFVELEENDYA